MSKIRITDHISIVGEVRRKFLPEACELCELSQ